MLLSVSFYTKHRVDVITPRSSELVDVVRSIQKDRDKLKSTLLDVRKQVSNYERKMAEKSGELDVFTKEEQFLKNASGLLPVKGSGIKIIVADATAAPSDSDPNNFIVHNTDIQAIVNAVWAGGAKAVSVNGQRMVGTSAIRCAGNIILINSNPVGSPYEIDVVGDVAKIKDTLTSDESIKLLAEQFTKTGINYEIREGETTIPPYRGSLGVDNSKLITGGGG